MRNFLLLIVVISMVQTDFQNELDKIVLTFSCPPECTFNHSEITSATAQFFPTNCSEICGILVLNENTDLSHSQLKVLFSNMTQLNGALRVENTLFTNLSFFTVNEDQGYVYHYCKAYGISIVNNSQLTDINFYEMFILYTDETTKECPYRIENNKLLDINYICFYYDFYDMKVSGNKKDCGCLGSNLFGFNIDQVENCLELGNLNLTDMNDTSVDLTSLSSAALIKGSVNIQRTNFKNLTFLTLLKEVRGRNGPMMNKILLNIQDNLDMTRLALPNLRILRDNLESGKFIVNLENLHPDFCVTYQEMYLFMSQCIYFENVHANYCEGEDQYIKLSQNMYEICWITTLKALKPDCKIIGGDLKIQRGDEEYVFKLENVQYLFGSISIHNTTLRNIDFLANLWGMAVLNDEPAIKIVSNLNLKYAYLPLLMTIITKHQRTVVVHNNPLLPSDSYFLYPMRYSTNAKFVGDQFENGTPQGILSIIVISVYYVFRIFMK